jgi:N-acetylglucosamine repressor
MHLLDIIQVENLNPVERKKISLKSKIVRYLYLQGSVTNSAICQKFTISYPTSIALLSELMEEGIIEKKGRGESDGGRKPDLYGLKSNSLYVLSIDVERYVTRMALFDNQHNCISGIQSYTLEISQDFTELEKLYRLALQLIKDHQIDNAKLAGVGICMAGLVSSTNGKNYTYFIDKDNPDNGQSIKAYFESKFNKPVFIENDVKSAALAEYRFGLAKDKNDVVVISMDWGVGIGIIMGGKLRKGAQGFAGEFGHIPMVENGLLCHCGKVGCLETVASGAALSRLAKEGIESGKSTMLSLLPSADRIEPSTIIDAALKGDQFSINLLAEIGQHLGKGIAILIQLLNPELIILGGEIARAQQYITVPVQQAINTYSMAQLSHSTYIALSTLGSEAKILGAVTTVMENIFES